MLKKINILIDALHTSGVRYCHWKSNRGLAEALAGQTDIDLLVLREDGPLFHEILFSQGFRPAVLNNGEAFPSMEHAYALDEDTGTLIHVHSYYRAITGESLAKNYHLPVEAMLLQNTRLQDGVRVPVKGAELVVFTLRMMMKHTTPAELVLLARERGEMRKEIDWLLEPAADGRSGSEAKALELLQAWLPPVDPALFTECVRAIRDRAPLLKRIGLANRLSAQLASYARHGAAHAWLSGTEKFAAMAFRRLAHSRTGMDLVAGGAVIAFVGPEATGKSTLIAETTRWLGEHFNLEHVHAGKPKSTLVTALPNLFLPALRSLLPKYRSGNVEVEYTAEETKKKDVPPLIFAIRACLLAYDRRALLSKAYARSANGKIILCDRYPSALTGAVDSPQMAQFSIALEKHPLLYRLSCLESRLYQQIPPPDLVIALTVPVEVAIQRNRTRGKEEPEDYVRRRHAQRSMLGFERAPVVIINTDQPLPQTVLEVKKAIWKVL